jgi:hypothetical protein
MKTALAIMFIVVMAYPITMRLAARLVRRKRERLVTLGWALARDERLPDELRSTLVWMVETACSSRIMMLAALAFPWFLVDVLQGRAQPIPTILEPDLRDLMDEFIGCHIASATAANPLFAFLMSLELAILVFFLIPFGRLSVVVRLPLMAMAKVERAGHSLLIA